MSREHGFTLFEVLVSMAIGGLALTSVGMLVVATSGGAARIERGRVDNDRTALVARSLGLLTASAHVDSMVAFQGTSREARFRALRTEEHEIALVDVRIVCGRDRLTLVVSGSEAPVVGPAIDRCAIEYLAGLGDPGPWVPAWVSRTDVPLALRVRYGVGRWTDTVAVLLGERG